MNEKKLELWLGFGKFFLGTFIIGLVTVVINYNIQSREVDLKDRELALRDKDSEFQEMERLGGFVTHALAENVAVRRRFSQYFSTVTRSSELRVRWKEYAGLVEEEYKATQARRKELEELENKLIKVSKKGKDVSSELKKIRIELLKTSKELELRKKSEKRELSLGVTLSERIPADLIFKTDDWENPIKFEVLRAFVELSQNIIEPIISNYKSMPDFNRKISPPEFDDEGRIYLTFEMPGVSYEELACWIKKNTTFDRVERYLPWYKLFYEESPEKRSNKVNVYYRLKDNRKIVDGKLDCTKGSNE